MDPSGSLGKWMKPQEKFFLGFHPLPKAPRGVQILLSETVFSCLTSFLCCWPSTARAPYRTPVLPIRQEQINSNQHLYTTSDLQTYFLDQFYGPKFFGPEFFGPEIFGPKFLGPNFLDPIFLDPIFLDPISLD